VLKIGSKQDKANTSPAGAREGRPYSVYRHMPVATFRVSFTYLIPRLLLLPVSVNN